MTITALSLVEAIADARLRLQREPQRLARLEDLQRWQVARLRQTYDDLYRQRQFTAALDFFMEDLYGPHDFSARDRDLQKALAALEHALPERGRAAIADALGLETLSLSLDLAMLDALAERPLTAESYAQAYRQIGRQEDRERQIGLIVSSGRALSDLVKRPLVRQGLKLARVPARLAGVLVLHDFLDRGFRAFEKIEAPGALLDAIGERETRIMQNLFAGSAQPFEWRRTAG